MGVDTRVRIGVEHDDHAIMDVLKTHLKATNVTVDAAKGNTFCGYIHFTTVDGNKRNMWVYRGQEGALPCISLSLGCDDESQAIMQKICEVFGGYYSPNDCKENWVYYQGMHAMGDGLPYFIRWAINNNFMKDNDDIDGLKNAIDEWNKIHKKITS